MDISRRNILIGGLFVILQPILRIKDAIACPGYGPFTKKINKKDLSNVHFVGHKEYLKILYPEGYKYSDDIVINNLTNIKNRKYISLDTGELYDGEIYRPAEYPVQFRISLKNISNGRHCSKLSIIYQDNTYSNKGPCFEAASFQFGESAIPGIVVRIKHLSGQNPSIFIVAKIDTDNSYNKVLVSNIYPYRQACDGNLFLEII